MIEYSSPTVTLYNLACRKSLLYAVTVMLPMTLTNVTFQEQPSSSASVLNPDTYTREGRLSVKKKKGTVFVKFGHPER